ncbi:hypothetical protein BP00DRAFT_489191 [Aspergillus indologenus CBS 114.80]|uniref:Protein kinase domain-containing protein n=1 Tax=Aspergillus indologenus CBS 114.80 TaxID=1450541 RepID=A0A2V5HTT8_9EURO|nr:hypothetical protein BP00DRAFT_489191 [Aspergillus indologenus CBS 114.80]
MAREPAASQPAASASQPPTDRWEDSPVDRDALRAHEYCTQRCLLGLQRRGRLDEKCPNVERHRVNGGTHHPTTVAELVQQIRLGLDHSLERAMPIVGPGYRRAARPGGSGAPFKVVSPRFGNTVIGKGTICLVWPRLEREADVYTQILVAAQGSAVPVFLGKINLQRPYELEGFGRVRHMLLMGYGGEEIGMVTNMDQWVRYNHETTSAHEIEVLGVVHKDLAPRNVLWNAELGRAMIIDFEACDLVLDRIPRRPAWISLARFRCGCTRIHV